MTRHPVNNDARYTVSREYCGHAEPRFVARFCGDWVGQSPFYASAVIMCSEHDAKRFGAIIVEEART